VKGKERIPEIHATAAVMLPGMRQSRAILDMSIRVLEYFDRHATRDAATGTFTINEPPPEDLQKDVQQFRSLLSAFGKLHAKPT
jgi:hypothetical protein